jgi:hypothetical protein
MLLYILTLLVHSCLLSYMAKFINIEKTATCRHYKLLKVFRNSEQPRFEQLCSNSL